MSKPSKSKLTPTAAAKLLRSKYGIDISEDQVKHLLSQNQFDTSKNLKKHTFNTGDFPERDYLLSPEDVVDKPKERVPASLAQIHKMRESRKAYHQDKKAEASA